MTRPVPPPVRLADAIACQLDQLADQLAQLSPDQAAQVTARVLDAETGVLGGVLHLLVTGSVFAKEQAERGVLPAEVCLALGRGANELHDIALDLEEHQGALQRLGSQPATAVSKPPAAPAPLVVRRRR
ncbi:hypothetical protein [Streptomyces buecherae]|uniref:hypothetical protein n=1 Tax=Streptomyces buecherae TaxID=2763006 RepID=UPI001C27DD12|nr:hypothetical protein [Streptomyces buecherae]